MNSPTSELELKCFHRGITKERANELLLATNQEGSFLVRESEVVAGAYALCVLAESRVYLYRILPTPDGKFAIKRHDHALGQKYNDISQLICEFMNKGTDNGLAGPLVYPILAQNSSNDYEKSEECHVHIIQALFNQLPSNITCISDIVIELFEKNMLREIEFEGLQHCLSTPMKACEELLKIIIKKPKDVFECFLQSLKKTHQQHIYQALRYPDLHVDINKESLSNHSRLIRQHIVCLSENIEPEFGLLTLLYQEKVLSDRECVDLKSCRDKYKMNDSLLLLISRKSPSQFQKFKEALVKTNQSHINKVFESDEAANENQTARKVRNWTPRATSYAKKRVSTIFEKRLKTHVLEEKSIDISTKVASMLEKRMDTMNDDHTLFSICVRNILIESYDLKKQMVNNDDKISKMAADNEELKATIEQLQMKLNSNRLSPTEDKEFKYQVDSKIDQQNETIIDERNEYSGEYSIMNESLNNPGNDSIALLDRVSGENGIEHPELYFDFNHY